MIVMYSKYDSMHKNEMFYALIYISNYIIICINYMLSIYAWKIRLIEDNGSRLRYLSHWIHMPYPRACLRDVEIFKACPKTLLHTTTNKFEISYFRCLPPL